MALFIDGVMAGIVLMTLVQLAFKRRTRPNPSSQLMQVHARIYEKTICKLSREVDVLRRETKDCREAEESRRSSLESGHKVP